MKNIIVTTVVALSIGSASVVSFAQDIDVPAGPVKPVQIVSRAVAPKGLASSEIPAFPSSVDRGRAVASLARLPSECGGTTKAAVADKVDRALGGRQSFPVAALVNLVLTENALSAEAVEAIILSLGRYSNGPAMLRTVARLSRKIATRLYDAQLDTEGRSEAAPELVITSMERELLLAVVDSAVLAKSPANRAVVASLSDSSIADVAAAAAAALVAW